jgi:LuxR family maltose regulon positive regulatory protein
MHSARMAALQAWVAAFRGRMVRAGEWARRALEGLPQGDSFLRSVSLMNLGIATLSEGDLAVGRQVLEDVARSCEESGNAMIAVMVLCHLAEVRAKQAQLYEARQIYQRAVDAATDAQGVRLPVAGEALMGLAELARQWNDLEAAERYATEGIDLASQWAKVGALEGYVTLARLRQSAGDLHGADEALQVARGLAVEFDATELDDHIVALAQARLWIDQGRFDALERWVRDRGVDRDQQASVPSGEDAWIDHHLHKYEALVLVRAHLAQGHLEEALALLEPLLERLQRRGRHDLTIEALTLKAVALEAQGREVDALAALGQALAQGELGGYVRVFADAGPPVARLLPKALAHRQAGFDISPDYVRTLLDALDATPTVLHPARQPLLDPLSEREMDVLRLLATGMSNPEIADALVVAVSTVRSHLKSIYSKLDVHKRWDAVQRAQDLGLL